MFRLIVILCLLLSACEKDEPIKDHGSRLEPVEDEGMQYDGDLLLDSKESGYDNRYLSPPEYPKCHFDNCGVYSLIYLECPFIMS
jgi:hypothetical protein